MTEEQDSAGEHPQLIPGAIVQWPKYAATYRGQMFTIAPVPTDDGRWIVSVNEWTDAESMHATVIDAVDAALNAIKNSVDSQAQPES